MKLSKLTIQQKFILKLIKENPTFNIQERANKIFMCDEDNTLFTIRMATYQNLKTLGLL